jgi:hypothetical protein
MNVENPYCTLLDVQKETKNSKPENTEWYETCIGIASRLVEDYCRRDFKLHDHTEDNALLVVPRSWVMQDEIHLPWPIIELESLWYFIDRVIGKTDKDIWPASDYYFEVGGSVITSEHPLLFSDVHPFRGNIVLKGKFGYETEVDADLPTGLPATIRKCTAVIAATISIERRLEQTNLEGNRIELVELVIPNDVYRQLNRYRNFSFMI